MVAHCETCAAFDRCCSPHVKCEIWQPDAGGMMPKATYHLSELQKQVAEDTPGRWAGYCVRMGEKDYGDWVWIHGDLEGGVLPILDALVAGLRRTVGMIGKPIERVRIVVGVDKKDLPPVGVSPVRRGDDARTD